MQIKRDKCLYEILLRFGPDGFVSAHVKDLEFMVEGSQRLTHTEREGDPRPITVEEVGAILGEKGAALVEAVEMASARATEAEHRAVEAEAKLAKAEARLAKVQAAVIS